FGGRRTILEAGVVRNERGRETPIAGETRRAPAAPKDHKQNHETAETARKRAAPSEPGRTGRWSGCRVGSHGIEERDYLGWVRLGIRRHRSVGGQRLSKLGSRFLEPSRDGLGATEIKMNPAS